MSESVFYLGTIFFSKFPKSLDVWDAWTSVRFPCGQDQGLHFEFLQYKYFFNTIFFLGLVTVFAADKKKGNLHRRRWNSSQNELTNCRTFQWQFVCSIRGECEFVFDVDGPKNSMEGNLQPSPLNNTRLEYSSLYRFRVGRRRGPRGRDPHSQRLFDLG